MCYTYKGLSHTCGHHNCLLAIATHYTIFICHFWTLFVFRLHMLQELEEYITILMNSSKLPQCKYSFENWKARFALVQVYTHVICYLTHVLLYSTYVAVGVISNSGAHFKLTKSNSWVGCKVSTHTNPWLSQDAI